MNDSTRHTRAARRVAIIGVILMPMIGAVGVMLLVFSPEQTELVPGGICIILLAGIAVTLGLTILRGQRASVLRAASRLRAAAAIVVVLGIMSTLTVTLSVPRPDDNGGGLLVAAGLLVIVLPAWWVINTMAQTVLRGTCSERLRS